ncbi:complement resistance protein TraT [Sulfurospirillum sp. 1612]|uniref:complement resistance protein TraT n=1 Tax=Sulfurospirillum sp. 1612 TaxID=3094835 RepID=UPI002F9442D7
MKKFLVGMMVLTAFLFSGCGTTTLQVQSAMTRTVSLSPKALEDKKVYLRVTGTTASILKLKAPLKQALLKRGVTLVDNPELATISMHVNTLFANNLKEAAHYGGAALGGATAGALASANGNSGGDSILIGITAALAMGIVENATRDETYRAVIDISLRTKNTLGQWSDEDKTRVLVQAVKMGLKPMEAKGIMETQAVQKIADILE